MNIRNILMLTLAMTALVVASGCDRAATFKSKLGEDEKVTMKSPVFIDDTEAGYVKELKIEAGERVAVLAFTDKRAAQEHIRAGVFRVIGEEGRIVLRSDGMKADATPLPTGAYIPSKSRVQYAVETFTNRRTLVIVVIAIAVILLGIVCLKSATHFVVLSLALALAGFSAWALHHYLVPEIQTLYQSMPATPKVDVSTADEASGAKAKSSLPTMDNFVDVLSRRPDPRVVAFAATFTVGFLLYVLLLSRAVQALKREEC